MAQYGLTLLLFSVTLVVVNAEIEICTGGGKNVFRITHDSCPHGVLFTEPQTADCVVFSSEDQASVMEEICSSNGYKIDKRQFQYFPDITKEEIQLNDSCKAINPTMCNLPTKKINSHMFIKPAAELDLAFDKDDSNATNTEFVKAQTRRLFRYMMGMAKFEIDDSLRVIMLLKKTFEIAKKFSPRDYLSRAFWDDVETAFLFIFQEGDSTRVRDLNNEEFETIMVHLMYCLDQKNPFVWEGLKCATYSVIQRVKKHDQLFNDFDGSNKDAFSKYDVPVEATWGAIDFVHGLCYGTFKDHINSHHLYQRAMERLFTREILFRWENRYVFQGQQDIWNHFFSANVKNALVNMDVSIQASYLATPFFHRLERPIDGKKVRRKRRWAETHSLKSFDSIEGHCFQSKEESENVLNDLMATCEPNTS